MKSFQILKKSLLVCFGLALLNSCSDDDNTPENTKVRVPAQGMPYVMSLAVQGSDDNFTYYTVPFDDLMQESLSPEGRGIEQPGYYDFTQIGQTIYSIGGLDDVNVVGISKDSEEFLTTTGDVSFAQSLSDMVNADANTVVSVSMDSSSDIITFRTFSKNSVSATSEKTIETSTFIDATDAGPSYSGMVVSDGHLFLSYYLSNPDNFETNYTDQAEVAVFSYPEMEFEKVITDERVGPIGGFNLKSGLIKDEAGNIYAISHTNPANGFSQFTKPSGILKINSGETEFDESYFFDIEQATGGYNTANVKYLSNGKAFAEINMAARADQAIWSDGPLESAIIDFNAQTVNYVEGLPVHQGPGRRMVAVKDGNKLYTCIPVENDGNYIYQVDINNFTATKGARVEANFAAGVFKLQ